MTTFKVRWEIEIGAASPREAAYAALQVQRDPYSIATMFEVVEVVWYLGQKVEMVDLSDPVLAYFHDEIETLEQAKAFLTQLHTGGKLYHLEDSPDQVIVSATGERLFTDEEADLLQERVDEVFSCFKRAGEGLDKYGGDPLAFVMDELLKIDAGDEA